MHPDRNRCYEILREYGTPAHVTAHCKAVAAVGYTLASALNERGFDLDLEVILAAGLLHDMARVEENHWDAAADFCEARGWHEEAAVIRVHMTYDKFNDLDHLNETDIICLADRTVLEDRYAGLDERIDYIVAKARRQGHEDYVPHILRRKEETRAWMLTLEERLGRSLDDLMLSLDYEHPEDH